MRKLDLAALVIIALGISFVIVGMLTETQSNVTGGIIFFIGPIPIFIGEGTPPFLVLLLVVAMAALTLLGFLMYRRQMREGVNL